MSNAELMNWIALDRIQPLPDGYWQAALVASTVARCLGARNARLEDFLPRRRGATVEQDGRAMVAKVAAVVAAVEARGGGTGIQPPRRPGPRPRPEGRV